jgi:hypothetical protein
METLPTKDDIHRIKMIIDNNTFDLRNNFQIKKIAYKQSI